MELKEVIDKVYRINQALMEIGFSHEDLKKFWEECITEVHKRSA